MAVTASSSSSSAGAVTRAIRPVSGFGRSVIEPSAPVGDELRVLAAPEAHGGLGQVRGDAEGVVRPPESRVEGSALRPRQPVQELLERSQRLEQPRVPEVRLALEAGGPQPPETLCRLLGGLQQGRLVGVRLADQAQCRGAARPGRTRAPPRGRPAPVGPTGRTRAPPRGRPAPGSGRRSRLGTRPGGSGEDGGFPRRDATGSTPIVRALTTTTPLPVPSPVPTVLIHVGRALAAVGMCLGAPVDPRAVCVPRASARPGVEASG